jgi:hypothetical protein
LGERALRRSFFIGIPALKYGRANCSFRIRYS